MIVGARQHERLSGGHHDSGHVLQIASCSYSGTVEIPFDSDIAHYIMEAFSYILQHAKCKPLKRRTFAQTLEEIPHS